MRDSLRIAPRGFAWVLFIMVVVLILGGLASAYGSITVERYFILKVLFRLFYLNEEANVPAWFSSAQWFLAALLAALIGFRDGRPSAPYAVHWIALGLIFLALSADEAAAIHEAVGVFVDSSITTSGYFTYSWVLLGIPFVALFVLAFARFLLHLPVRIRTLFILAGGIYVFGALGLEMLAAGHEEELSPWGYQVVVAAEEFAEMLGVVVLIYALLSHIEGVGGGIIINVGAAREMQRGAASAPAPLPAGAVPWRLVGVTIAGAVLIVAGVLALFQQAPSPAPTEPVPVTTAAPAPTDLDRTLDGQLGPGDRRLSRDGSYVDVHAFEIPANALVTVSMRSTEFDPYLAVVRPDGTRVAQDDSPRSQASEVEFVTATGGSYHVLANAYRADGVGAYQLRIQTRALTPVQEKTGVEPQLRK